MSMTADQVDVIKSGIEAAVVLYFSVGGAILVVIAGMWGFDKIRGLMGDGGGSSSASDERRGNSGRGGYDEQMVHSRYIDRYGWDAYNKRFNG